MNKVKQMSSWQLYLFTHLEENENYIQQEYMDGSSS